MRILTRDEKCVGCELCELLCSLHKFKVNNPKKAAIRVSRASSGEGYIISVCQQCADPPCAQNCPVNALSKAGNRGMVIDEEKCTKCGSCLNACEHKAVFFHDEVEAAIICDLCGANPECVSACPTGALSMERGSGRT